MIEVEQKYWLDDEAELVRQLERLGATELDPEEHSDHYFNHPTRDFRETNEALRLRQINGVAYVTYKGPRMPGDVKARQEMEWCLAPGDPYGRNTEELWRCLGLRPVAVVRKRRRCFQYSLATGQEPISITIDRVVGVGLFSEIELVVENVAQVEQARAQILELANRLGLHRSEPQSYLSLTLTRVECTT